MEVLKTLIEGVVIIEPRLFKDGRGCFFESFNQKEFEEKVCKTTFVQDNESKSSYGVIRGLHFQKTPFAQSKLVRVVKGTVLDVAVDIRKGSPTFGQHVAVELTENNYRQPLVSGKKLRVIKKASFDDTLITWPNQLLCPLKETV